jgi:hypothetical protein
MDIERFPEDFMFELTNIERETLRCQIGASKVENPEARGGDRFAPFVTNLFNYAGTAAVHVSYSKISQL